MFRHFTTAKPAILSALCLILFSCANGVPNSSTLRYQNEDVGVKAYLDKYWYVFTDAENTAPAFANQFPADKGKNQSPLFIGVYQNSQLYTRLSVEVFNGTTTEYVHRLSKAINNKGLNLLSVKQIGDQELFELEYSNNNKAIRFRERVSAANNNYKLRMSFWGPLAYMPYYQQFINHEFNYISLQTKQKWGKPWAEAELNLAEENLSGVELVAHTIDHTAILNCGATQDSLLWKITSPKNTVYLFGTIHIGHKSFYPLHETIETAFRNSDYLVLEVNPTFDDYLAVQHVIRSRSSMEVGESLNDMISKKTSDTLSQQLSSMGLPSSEFFKLKPWFMSMTLSNLHTSSAGYSSSQGIESYLRREKPRRIKVLQLESFIDQISMTEHLNSEAQLINSLRGYEYGPEQVQAQVNLWRCGDLEGGIASPLSKHDLEFYEDMKFIHHKVLTERNIKMTEKIQQYVNDGKGDYFVAIGAAHLSGDDSVVTLLRKQGIKVEKVSLPWITQNVVNR